MAVLRHLTRSDLDNSIFLEDILLIHGPARHLLFCMHNYGLRRRRCCPNQLVIEVRDHHGRLAKRVILQHWCTLCSCVHGCLIPASSPKDAAIRGEREIHLLILVSLEVAQKVVL
jgi:hypothetical protein